MLLSGTDAFLTVLCGGYEICVRCKRKSLDMRHVLRAVSAEYEKMEQSVSADIWGEYGYLMDF